MMTDFNFKELHIGDKVIVAVGKDFKLGVLLNDDENETRNQFKWIRVKLSSTTIDRHPDQLIKYE